MKTLFFIVDAILMILCTPIIALSYVWCWVVASWNLGEIIFAPERFPASVAKFSEVWAKRPWNNDQQ